MSAQLSFDLSRPATPLGCVLAKPEAFRPGFRSWLQDNVHIWQRFEREANAIWNSGRRHYSARTIGEFIRHETSLRETASQFKVNDHVWPDCARLYVLLNPDREGFFETRVSRMAPRLI